VESAAMFTVGGGEARRSYYGTDLAARLEAALRVAARATDAVAPAPDDPPRR
jgi:hypothetical protein